jgi:hypothetical protein
MGSHYVLAAALIYRCTVGGVTTFSDRPCAAESAPYEPDTSRISTYDPPPANRTATSAAPARPTLPRRRASGAEDQARRAAACERIRNGLRDVAARMRAGYDAKQGERLRERKTKLDQQRRAQKCP